MFNVGGKLCTWLKGHYVVSEKPPFEARKVAGSATRKNKKSQLYEFVSSFKVDLFIQFINSWKQKELVYLIFLGSCSLKLPSAFLKYYNI